jgi:hypothetical protein
MSASMERRASVTIGAVNVAELRKVNGIQQTKLK